jgi:hypothetical protein
MDPEPEKLWKKSRFLNYDREYEEGVKQGRTLKAIAVLPI